MRFISGDVARAFEIGQGLPTRTFVEVLHLVVASLLPMCAKTCTGDGGSEGRGETDAQ
jgi:hypothetical protein